MSNVQSGWRSWWSEAHDSQTEQLEQVPQYWVKWGVFLASAITLYVELVMVRWHSTCFHAFAIFKNISLLSCFLGLGIGYALSRKSRSTLAIFLPLLALQALLFGLLSSTQLGGRRINPVAEQLVMGNFSNEWSWLDAVEGNAFLALVFVLNALMFIPLGHLAGKLMSRLPRLQAYSLNLLGSLAGILVFTVLSLVWAPPGVWIGLAVASVAPFLLGSRRVALASVLSVGIILITLGAMGRRLERRYYSPYQLITLRMPKPDAKGSLPSIRVNHCFYQQIWNCAADGPTDKHSLRARDYYDQPYKLKPDAKDVLVVGAGSGNDVAGALRHTTKSVTACEIDPTIIFLGKHLHPERPYNDPRTKIEINDARSYLRQTEKQFDVIVYGLLDSHTNLGSMTNVRLDSFVYTVEGFKEAAARLSENGIIFVSYVILDPLQEDKLYAMLAKACPGHTPRVFDGKGGRHYVTGPGVTKLVTQGAKVKEVTRSFVKRGAVNAELATDDWPFFYMQKREYPLTYALMIGLLLVLSAVLVKKQMGSFALFSHSRNLAFFFLGAGFMLIETKSITELGLTFGNTWHVISVVIGGILIMVFLANQWIARRGPVSPKWSFLGLAITLVLGWVINRQMMGGMQIPAAKLLMPLILTAPLFFAGLIFSSELASGGEIGSALSANLFGAMLGGFLEDNSMYWCYRSLYARVIPIYGLAFVFILRASKSANVVASQEPQSDPTDRPARAA